MTRGLGVENTDEQLADDDDEDDADAVYIYKRCEALGR